MKKFFVFLFLLSSVSFVSIQAPKQEGRSSNKVVFCASKGDVDDQIEKYLAQHPDLQVADSKVLGREVTFIKKK